jgi:hypothetical protein
MIRKAAEIDSRFREHRNQKGRKSRQAFEIKGLVCGFFLFEGEVVGDVGLEPTTR